MRFQSGKYFCVYLVVWAGCFIISKHVQCISLVLQVCLSQPKSVFGWEDEAMFSNLAYENIQTNYYNN